MHTYPRFTRFLAIAAGILWGAGELLALQRLQKRHSRARRTALSS